MGKSLQVVVISSVPDLAFHQHLQGWFKPKLPLVNKTAHINFILVFFTSFYEPKALIIFLVDEKQVYLLIKKSVVLDFL